MKSRPILFQGDMVRAIMSGKKTQTRRIVKPQPIQIRSTQGGEPCELFAWHGSQYRRDQMVADYPPRCPFGNAGDKLWIRETFRFDSRTGYHYAADEPTLPKPRSWKPAIHMPREACRLEVLITTIRIERLVEISEKDAAAEGAISIVDYCRIWERINGNGSWVINPWVWIVDFERVMQ